MAKLSPGGLARRALVQVDPRAMVFGGGEGPEIKSRRAENAMAGGLAARRCRSRAAVGNSKLSGRILFDRRLNTGKFQVVARIELGIGGPILPAVDPVAPITFHNGWRLA